MRSRPLQNYELLIIKTIFLDSRHCFCRNTAFFHIKTFVFFYIHVFIYFIGFVFIYVFKQSRSHTVLKYQEEFEDTKGELRIRKSKERKHNDQTKKDKRTRRV